jgi:DNA-binding CsgD family transcriptional regulator
VNCNIADINVQALKSGFIYRRDTGAYHCLYCGAAFERGVIVPEGEHLLDARKAAQSHLETAHGSAFRMLLAEDRRYTGLTETQKEILSSHYQGLSDKQIAAVTNTSPSTVRYQRFCFREKAKQAKVLLALSELLAEKRKQSDDEFTEIHAGATMIDERYMITEAEAQKVKRSFFLSLTPPKLRIFPPKQKSKLIILKVIAGLFDMTATYTEKQVNTILADIYDDYVTLRRYLIEYGFMDRKPDGSAYWLKSGTESGQSKAMNA